MKVPTVWLLFGVVGIFCELSGDVNDILSSFTTVLETAQVDRYRTATSVLGSSRRAAKTAVPYSELLVSMVKGTIASDGMDQLRATSLAMNQKLDQIFAQQTHLRNDILYRTEGHDYDAIQRFFGAMYFNAGTLHNPETLKQFQSDCLSSTNGLIDVAMRFAQMIQHCNNATLDTKLMTRVFARLRRSDYMTLNDLTHAEDYDRADVDADDESYGSRNDSKADGQAEDQAESCDWLTEHAAALYLRFEHMTESELKRSFNRLNRLIASGKFKSQNGLDMIDRKFGAGVYRTTLFEGMCFPKTLFIKRGFKSLPLLNHAVALAHDLNTTATLAAICWNVTFTDKSIAEAFVTEVVEQLRPVERHLAEFIPSLFDATFPNIEVEMMRNQLYAHPIGAQLNYRRTLAKMRQRLNPIGNPRYGRLIVFVHDPPQHTNHTYDCQTNMCAEMKEPTKNASAFLIRYDKATYKDRLDDYTAFTDEIRSAMASEIIL